MADGDRAGEIWRFDSGLCALVLESKADSAGYGWYHLAILLDAGHDEERWGAEGKTLYLSESWRYPWGTKDGRLVQRV